MKWLLVIMAVVVVALAAHYWARTPMGATPHSHHGGSDCANCHKGSIPLTHIEDFLTEHHGAAAKDNRALCLGCHDEQDHCQHCHLSQSPEWETDGVRNPGRNPKDRDEHSRLASAHWGSCMECHTVHFRSQCSGCHRPDEFER